MDYFYGKPKSFGTGLSPYVRIRTATIKSRQIAPYLRYKKGVNRNQTLKKGEKFMRIEFDKFEDTTTNPNKSGKTFPIIRVHGKALSGKLEGNEWTTQFFQSAKEMVSQVKSLNKGDIVDVKMVSNGNFWNPTSFTKVNQDGNTGTKAEQLTSVAKELAENTGKVAKRDALNIAVHIVGPKKASVSALDYLTKIKDTVKLVEDFVDESGPFQFKNGGIDTDIPEVNEINVD